MCSMFIEPLQHLQTSIFHKTDKDCKHTTGTDRINNKNQNVQRVNIVERF